MLSSLSLNFSDSKNWVKSLSKVCIYITLIIIVLIPRGLSDNYQLGKALGVGSLFSFLITTIPGTIRRFELKGIWRKIQVILTYSRAQWGILMFLLASSHYYIVFIYPYVSIGQRPTIQLFTAVSAIAFYLAFPLFVTSNTWSKKRLKRNWQKLHNLTYLIIWLIFLHVALIGELLLTIIILATAVLQICSFIFSYLKQKSSP
ncbi:MAG: hypothetical protein AAGF07_00345 [Patescibacteria group bacterium]